MHIQYMYKNDIGFGNRYGKDNGIACYLCTEADAEIEKYKSLLSRVMEWNPAFPVESSLLDDIADALKS